MVRTRAHHRGRRHRNAFPDRQKAFLDFVLAQYEAQGVQELDPDNLSPLLRLRYRDSIPDALADLGDPTALRAAFTGFQRHLYHPPAG